MNPIHRFTGILESRDQLPMLDSATKYPSIETYHVLGERGRLTEDLSVQFPAGQPVWLTEKVDGTNARIIVFPNGNYLIGSRDDLLYGAGDLIPNPTLGIVETLLGQWTTVVNEEVLIGTMNWSAYASPYCLVVIFTEVYGFGVGKAAKIYAHTSQTKSYRLFDIVRIPLESLANLLAMTPERVARWRDTGGQTFVEFSSLSRMSIPVVPPVAIVQPGELPKSIEEANTFLHTHIGHTQCSLTAEYAGPAEGLVVRTNDRKAIAKMRFEDYARTLRSVK